MINRFLVSYARSIRQGDENITLFSLSLSVLIGGLGAAGGFFAWKYPAQHREIAAHAL